MKLIYGIKRQKFCISIRNFLGINKEIRENFKFISFVSPGSHLVGFGSIGARPRTIIRMVLQWLLRSSGSPGSLRVPESPGSPINIGSPGGTWDSWKLPRQL